MRRFESMRAARLETAAGRNLDVWLGESFAHRLAGLIWLPGLPPGRALLLPGCRSVHRIGMRFAFDVGFVSWPPRGGWCEVMAARGSVPPFRILAARRLPGAVAALEARAGTFVVHGLGPGSRVSVNQHEGFVSAGGRAGKEICDC
jgi:hypothetical protein